MTHFEIPNPISHQKWKPIFVPPKPMFDTVCTFPLTSDVLAQSIHPTSPLLAVGLATGHVEILRLPHLSHNRSSPDSGGSDSDSGACKHPTIDTVWSTRRHKGSCRSLAFSADGAFLFSAGSDGLVKAAVTETGHVVSKIAVPLDGSISDPATLIHTLSPQSFLLATESSALHIYDLRAPTYFISSQPQKTFNPHEDYISSLSPLAAGEASQTGFSKQWISTGGTSIAVTDLRRGVLKSEDLGEELLSSVVLSDGSVVVGGERGVLRIWKDGLLEQEGGRIVLKKGETLDVLGRAPAGTGKGEGETVVAGMGDGTVQIVSVQRRKVIGEARHDDVEGVLGIGFEVDGRMISCGGPTVKVWEESIHEVTLNEDIAATAAASAARRPINGDGAHSDNSEEEKEDENDDEVSNESSEDEAPAPKRRKKRKRNGGKAGNHHVLSSFRGLD